MNIPYSWELTFARNRFNFISVDRPLTQSQTLPEVVSVYIELYILI